MSPSTPAIPIDIPGRRRQDLNYPVVDTKDKEQNMSEFFEFWLTFPENLDAAITAKLRDWEYSYLMKHGNEIDEPLMDEEIERDFILSHDCPLMTRLSGDIQAIFKEQLEDKIALSMQSSLPPHVYEFFTRLRKTQTTTPIFDAKSSVYQEFDLEGPLLPSLDKLETVVNYKSIFEYRIRISHKETVYKVKVSFDLSSPQTLEATFMPNPLREHIKYHRSFVRTGWTRLLSKSIIERFHETDL